MLRLRLREACRAEAENYDLEGPNEDLCERDATFILGEDGVILLPAYACEDFSQGMVLPFSRVESLYEPTSPLAPVIRALATEDE